MTVGLWAGGRFPARQIGPYIVVQLAGAIAAAAFLYAVASGKPGFDAAAGFAANGYGDHSPGNYTLASCLLTELVMTFMFVLVILGATHTRAPVGFAGLASGPPLTLPIRAARMQLALPGGASSHAPAPAQARG